MKLLIEGLAVAVGIALAAALCLFLVVSLGF